MIVLNSFIVICCICIISVLSAPTNNEIEECVLPNNLRSEIASYKDTVNKIIDTVVNGKFKGTTYNELANFVDKFGNRKAGTKNLENAIDYMIDLSKKYHLNDVVTEDVTVPNWVRGSESATLILPRRQNLNMLGIGYSVGTPKSGIEAEVLVVKSFDDLKQKANQARGKIVLFNPDWVSYGVTVQYRSKGASEAAKAGAVACLIRSITQFSINSPHTGMQTYEANVTQIPIAAITVEDTHMLQRMQDRGETIKILLKMEAQLLDPEISRNTIIDIKGSHNPEKLVIVSGHIDSWDVGQGAMDDGGGMIVSWTSLALLRELNLTPKRSVRAILWTSEEFGLIGAQAYADAHEAEFDNLMFIMESDIGNFEPVGLEYSAGEQGGCIIQEILQLLEPINATQAVNSSAPGSDIGIWTGSGYPGASLTTKNDRYFWFHHSPGDTLDILNSDDLDKNTAVFASVAYVLADLSIDFPRELPIKPLGKTMRFSKKY